jgi:hypothetical protein
LACRFHGDLPIRKKHRDRPSFLTISCNESRDVVRQEWRKPQGLRRKAARSNWAKSNREFLISCVPAHPHPIDTPLKKNDYDCTSLYCQLSCKLILIYERPKEFCKNHIILDYIEVLFIVIIQYIFSVVS